MSTHGLELGSLDLASPFEHESGCTFSVLADGATFGGPQAVVKSIVSMLADGDLVTYDRAGNRVVSFTVEIQAPDGFALNAGEMALRRELYRRNTVTWTPPADFGPTSVYEVLTSEMSQSFDDLDEMKNRRKFLVTLTCAPFARSADLVNVAALTVGTTTVSIDDGTSATGWTGTYEGAPAAVATTWEAGSVGVAELDNAVTSPDTWTMTRTGSVDFTTTPYLLVEVRTLSSDAAPPINVTAAANGASVPLLSVNRIPGTVYYSAVFDLRGVGVTSSLTFTHVSRAGEPWQGMFIRQMSRTNVPPGINARQLTRILPVGGTERTPASIHVKSANGTDILGTTIVHTCPEDGSGYSPPLRRWRTSGNTVNTSGAPFSSGREPIHPNAFTARVPTSVLPRGGYVAAAFLRCTTTTNVRIYWAVDTTLPGGEVMGQFADNLVWSFQANVWMLVPLGIVTLPTVTTDAGTISFSIVRDATSSAQVEIDDAWLFREGQDCAVSVVNVAHPHLWLNSPDVSNPVLTVQVGSDAMNRTHPGSRLVAPGEHILSPDGTALFTASSLTDNPAADASFYRRGHSNAPE